MAKRVSCEDAEFFKVFHPELHSHQLRIPPDYVKHFNRTIRERVILRDTAGKTWHVTVEKTQDGVFLKNGWQSFVSYHTLTVGEFLVFRYDKSYSFLVKIYSINGCKKELFVASDNTKEEMNAKQTLGKRASPRNKETGVSFDSSDQCPFFVSHPKPYKMEIPKGVRNNVHVETEMVLRDAKGKDWDVNITTSSEGRVHIGKGWFQFRVDNDLDPKDSCKFTFGAEKSSRVIHVQILRRNVLRKKLRC